MKSTTFNAAIIFLCTFFFSNFSFAQSSFFIGPMATGHVSKYEVSDDFSKDFTPWGFDGNNLIGEFQSLETKSKLGLSGGVSLGLQFGRFAIVTGARYCQKGGSFESRRYKLLLPNYDPNDPYYFDVLDQGTLKIKEQQNYVHIPLLARYQIIGEEVGFTLALGPAFNIGIGKASRNSTFEGQLTDEFTSEQWSAEFTYGKDLGDLYKPKTTSFVISPGVVFPVGEQGKLNLTLYWESDLTSAINENYRDRYSTSEGVKTVRLDGDKKNKSFGIGISYEHHLDFNIGSHH